MNKPNRLRALLFAASALTGVATVPSAVAQTAAPAPAPTPTPSPAVGMTAARPVAAFSDSIQPQWGQIRGFWGDNTPFWGQIRGFWGDAGPYADDLTPFWGQIRGFSYTPVDGSLTPSWGQIRGFAGDIGASWGQIRGFWGGIGSYSAAPQDYTTLATMLNGMVNQSQTVFGAAVQAQTGQSFTTAFANPLFAKYGIDLNNPQSLASLDANAREHFFLDWWDGLMNYSGVDHIDHWMKEVNWSPALTQQVGLASHSTVGILDFSITGPSANNVVKYSGVSNIANGHGAAVASLIVDPMDGKGVMGVAPNSYVIAYNPYDATQTAGWSDITNGIVALTTPTVINGQSLYANVVNASLGVPGWTLNSGWNTVFTDPRLTKTLTNTIFVMAAGNDGIVQTQNIAWNNHNPAIIVVGSVDPTGTISSFSNQPGTVCLGDANGNCGKNPDLLMNHFMVAPGEMMLVSDGQGGVTRYSGTSFAAPLVSGTIALIQNRWPWLTNQPNDVVNILFKSAKDLGAPGVDPVYGNGELDIGAALSPLDWSKLQIKQLVNGKLKVIQLQDLQATSAATRATWEANSIYFTLFENTGKSYRDFEVPVSTKLANQTVSVGGVNEQFMSYLTSRFTSWIGAPASAGGGGDDLRGLRFTDLRGNTSQLTGFGDAEATLTMRPRVNRLGFRGSDVPFESSLRLASADRRFNFEVGDGSAGAAALGGQDGFAMSSDHDPATGGANPFLGFASGGAYSRVEMRLVPGVSVAGGVSRHELRRDLDGLPLEARRVLGDAQAYQASATTMALDLQPWSRLRTTVGYTMLHENDAVLGMASANPNDVPLGSTTDAATAGADWALTHGVSLSVSASVGRTRAGDTARSPLAVGPGGLMSSSFQLGLAKERLFDRHDHLRVSFAQPMHVESGSVDVSMLQVVDRTTGGTGIVTQQTGITAPQRRYVAEMLYGRDLLNGTAQLSLFGRANINAQASDQLPGVIGGSSFRLAF